MKLLDTTINMFMIYERSKLTVKEDGTSRFILNANENKSILLLEFNEKFTKYLTEDRKYENIMFIQGNYSILKNKKEVPFAKIEVTRIGEYKKDKVLKIGKLRNEVFEDYKKLDLEKIQEKYKHLGVSDAIKGIYENIENEKINKIKQSRSKQTNSKEIKWYDKKDNLKFVSLDVNKIEVKDEIYSKGKIQIELKKVFGSEYINHVVVKNIGNEKYELVMGVKAYIRAKILNKNVQAYITDMDRDEFIKYINSK